MPAVGFGTLIPDLAETKQATRTALEVGFRHLDCAERYRNEEAVGDALREIVEVARIKPAVVQVESHPYLPEWELLSLCQGNGIVLLAFAALGHSSTPNLLEDKVIRDIAARLDITPAQVVLSWAVQRGTAFLITSTNPQRIQENVEISPLPGDAMIDIRERITTNVRFNAVIDSGVPGFIPRATSQEPSA
jgi:diketogulonate reductase-like aldo/keto reductase